MTACWLYALRVSKAESFAGAREKGTGLFHVHTFSRFRFGPEFEPHQPHDYTCVNACEDDRLPWHLIQEHTTR